MDTQENREESQRPVNEPTYHVVFEYTPEAGGYEGVRTITSFKSKEAFDEWYTPEIRAKERVMAEGVSFDRAQELVEQTPAACYLNAALGRAMEQEDPESRKFILEMELSKVMFAIADSRRRQRERAASQ